MRTLFLMVNNSCNINCSYCFYATGYQRRLSSRISQSQIPELASKIAQLRFNEVILTGGEPLHRKWKKETYALIHELKKRKIRVILNTSATFLQNEDFKKIINLKIDRLDISIDSHIPKIHNNQRGRYKDVVGAIKGLISQGYRAITTTTVVTEQNASTIVETIQWLREIGVNNIRIQPVFLPNGLSDNKKEIIFNAIKVAMRQLGAPHADKYSELIKASFKKDAPSPKALGATAFCRMGKQYFVCDPTGDLTPCFHRSDIKLGNLLKDSISKIKSILKINLLVNEGNLPKCFGVHCVSLFDSPNFWKIKHEKD